MQPEQGQQAGRQIQQLGVRVPVPQAFVGAALGEHVALLGVPPLLVGALEGGAVFDDADAAVDLAGCVPLGCHVDRQQVHLRRQGEGEGPVVGAALAAEGALQDRQDAHVVQGVEIETLDRLRRGAEDLGQPLVAVGDPQVGAEMEDAHRRVLDQRPVARLRARGAALGRTVGGFAPDDQHHPGLGLPRCAGDVGTAHRDRVASSLAVDELHRGPVGRGFIRPGGRETQRLAGQVADHRKDMGEALAAGLEAGPAGEGFGERVHQGDQALPVADDDGVADVAQGDFEAAAAGVAAAGRRRGRPIGGGGGRCVQGAVHRSASGVARRGIVGACLFTMLL